MKQRSFADKFWRNENGEQTVIQPANAPLSIWLVTYVARIPLEQSSDLYRLLDLIGYGILFTWAFLEITSGDSYFRRVLGVIVMVVIIANRL